MTFDSKTKKVPEDSEHSFFLDEKRLKKGEELDGYYVIINNEYVESTNR